MPIIEKLVFNVHILKINVKTWVLLASNLKNFPEISEREPTIAWRNPTFLSLLFLEELKGQMTHSVGRVLLHQHI